ncbi:MAG: ATP-binding protein [Betaproteobacteria bacterium]
MKSLKLRTALIFLLMSATVGTFLLLGAGTLLYRLPQISEASREAARHDATLIAGLLEFNLRSIEARIEPAVNLLQAPHDHADLPAHLDAIVGDGKLLTALYILDAANKIEATSRLAAAPVTRPAAGADLAANLLAQRARQAQKAVWSDQYPSPITNRMAIGVALPAGDHVVIAEVASEALLEATRSICRCVDHVVLVVDSRGQWLAGNVPGSDDQLRHLIGHPAITAAVQNTSSPETFEVEGEPYHAGHAASSQLGWTFIVGMAAGMNNPMVRTTILLIIGGLLAALIVSALLAPLLAAQLLRPLRLLMARTHRLAAGDYGGQTRCPTRIAEFNTFFADSDRMVSAIQARQSELERTATRLQGKENELEMIFNFSPVAMSVSDALHNYEIITVNKVWEKQFGRRREQVVGQNGAQIGLWASDADRCAFIACVDSSRAVNAIETYLLHSDGSQLLCRISGKNVDVGDQRFLIMVQEDITTRRRIEQEIRDLNAELETRVQRRTEDLAKANEELAETLKSLQTAQRELVNSENLAALGRLVAGVAHELNTPLGNGMMAATTLRDQLREFRASLAGGIKRQAFDALLENADTAADIMVRNLERGANLINNFKQLAVDQASAHRRHFSLVETVNETLSILRPTMKRTPYRIETNIPDDIRFDSYPGALEQVLTNLINNAIIHGFEGRDHGTMTLTAERIDAQWVRLQFTDDGRGIPAAMQPNIFKPFFTSKLGRGGSGLGLHIAHNAVVNMLGGEIVFQSVENEGTRFEITLPLEAPVKAPAAPPEMTSARTIVGK